jgi:S1-C subfamily serine protease
MGKYARALEQVSGLGVFLTLRAATLAATLALLVVHAAALRAAPLTGELQKQVRAATFEVVLKKPEKDTLTYEKPLPLELIPFRERNDKYRSVGTAFAITPTTFVTAAHVIGIGITTQFGPAAIRDSEGNVYPIDRILKYANHEDFVVFTVTGAPAVTPLATNLAAAVDDPVFAVGNALGEGIVIRDGLLTSFTPEAQDGRWKWLRFSAAASPGNSGGPLLDAQGRIVGIVAAKSPNENLNYALPIERVLNAPDKSGTFEVRESFGIPKLLHGTIVANFSESFPLPQAFPDFARAARAVFLKYYQTQNAKLLAQEADTIFPRGQSADMLATVYSSRDPSMLAQEEDKTWDAHRCAGTETRLPGDGRVWYCGGTAAGVLFRLQYPGYGVEERHYKDSKEFMDLILKGLPLPREVGSQAVRVTSAGAALQESLFRDSYGRVWQQRTWAIGYADMYLTTLALATPDGYVGILTMVPSGLAQVQAELIRFLANYFYVSYTGSLPQWQAFLERRELRPAVFDHVKLQYEYGKDLRFDSPRLQFNTAGMATTSAQSALDLRMTFMMDHGKLIWDVGGIELQPDRDKKGFIAANRQPNPGADAEKQLRDRWDHMSKGDGEFSGKVQHDNDLTDFWIRTVARREGGGAGDATRPLYEIVYNTDQTLLPRETEDLKGKLAGSFKITE